MVEVHNENNIRIKTYQFFITDISVFTGNKTAKPAYHIPDKPFIAVNVQSSSAEFYHHDRRVMAVSGFFLHIFYFLPYFIGQQFGL